jgi:hypothetical protein
MLVNNAGVAHYMPLAELPADKAMELVNVKILAPRCSLAPWSRVCRRAAEEPPSACRA